MKKKKKNFGQYFLSLSLFESKSGNPLNPAGEQKNLHFLQLITLWHTGVFGLKFRLFFWFQIFSEILLQHLVDFWAPPPSF